MLWMKRKSIKSLSLEEERKKPCSHKAHTVVSLDERSDAESEKPEEEKLSFEAQLEEERIKLNSLVNDLTRSLEIKTEELLITFRESREFQEMVKALWYSEQKPKANDFLTLRTLGRGAFGVVSCGQHIATGQLIAIKKMSKRLLKGKEDDKIYQN